MTEVLPGATFTGMCDLAGEGLIATAGSACRPVAPRSLRGLDFCPEAVSVDTGPADDDASDVPRACDVRERISVKDEEVSAAAGCDDASVGEAEQSRRHGGSGADGRQRGHPGLDHCLKFAVLGVSRELPRISPGVDRERDTDSGIDAGPERPLQDGVAGSRPAGSVRRYLAQPLAGRPACSGRNGLGQRRIVQPGRIAGQVLLDGQGGELEDVPVEDRVEECAVRFLGPYQVGKSVGVGGDRRLRIVQVVDVGDDA